MIFAFVSIRTEWEREKAFEFGMLSKFSWFCSPEQCHMMLKLLFQTCFGNNANVTLFWYDFLSFLFFFFYEHSPNLDQSMFGNCIIEFLQVFTSLVFTTMALQIFLYFLYVFHSSLVQPQSNCMLTIIVI